MAIERNTEWHPLHPLSPLIRASRVVIVAVIAAVQQIEAVFGAPFVALGFFGAGVIVAGIYGWISYRWTGFRATSEQIELKTGLLFRQHRRIPLDRIEAIDVARPLIARMLGLVELRVEVASGGGSEMKFQYLDEQDAISLREYVLQLRSQAPTASPAGEPPIDEPASEELQTATASSPSPAGSSSESRVVLEIPATDVLLAYGLVRVAATAVAAVFLLIAGVALGEEIIMGVLITALPIVLAIVLTTLKVVENFWGFRVSHDERGFSVRKGLFNELTQKVPVARIQAVRIEEPWLWRFFGRGRLIVDVAGYRNVKVDGVAETAVLAPVATMQIIHSLLTELIGTLDIDRLTPNPVPTRAKWRSPIAYRFMSISGDGNWAVSRYGVFNRRTTVVSHTKTQSIQVTQGVWQRRLGLGSLHIHTAGSRIHFTAPHRDIDDAITLAYSSRDLSETST